MEPWRDLVREVHRGLGEQPQVLVARQRAGDAPDPCAALAALSLAEVFLRHDVGDQ